MRTVVVSVIGLIVGFIAGILLFDQGPGIELLPIILAIVCAFAGAVVERQIRRSPRRS